MKEFDLHSLSPEISARSDEILRKYELPEVSEKSAGAATFYAWVSPNRGAFSFELGIEILS